MKNILCFFLASLPLPLLAQLKSGPMLGYNTMREVAVWVQTEKETSLRFVVFQPKDSTNSKQEYIYTTSEQNAFTATLIAKNLFPGTTYNYFVLGNESKILAEGEFTTQELWQHRRNPPDFSFAVGSCAYIDQKEFDREGEPFGKSLEIFDRLLEKGPSFYGMAWGQYVLERTGLDFPIGNK